MTVNHALEPAIRVQGIEKSFKDVHVLRGVDLDVKSGSIFALLGSNGAGKTTLVRILSTLLKPDAGTATVGGFDIDAQSGDVRQSISLTGQFAAVDEVLTGRENLEMVGRLYRLSPKDAKVRAEEALERLNLADAADRSVRTYSGGMRRRLDLGASLVGRPRVLILDEPTTGLDPRTRMELWAFIQQLVRDGTTVLLTTQYLEEADALAQSIVVIDHGKVIARGTSDELKSQLGGDVLEVGIQRAADMERVLTALGPLGAEASQVDGEGRHLAIPTAAGASALVDAVRALDDAEVAIADLSLRRPSLDDVFLALTGRKSTADDEPDGAADGGRPAGRRSKERSSA
jgi:ABC-2 type transport system ATP-binding protein